MTRYGFDALGRPCTPQDAARLGFRFVWHYLGQVSRAEVDAYHQAGVDVALFKEHGTGDVNGGAPIGREYALEAKEQLDALGAPVGCALAVDFFPANPTIVIPYFQGAHSILGDLCGGYGDYAVVETLASSGLCPAGLVQSVSGSGSSYQTAKVSAHAHFLQLNDVIPPDAPTIPGRSLLSDYDVEIQLIPSSPLLWRPPFTPSPTPEDDMPKLARFVVEQGDGRLYLEVDGTVTWMSGTAVWADYARLMSIPQAFVTVPRNYLAGRPGKLSFVPAPKPAHAAHAMAAHPSGSGEPDWPFIDASHPDALKREGE